MIKKSTIFDWMAGIMTIFGISVLSLCLFCFLFGEDARGYSTMFALGSQGLSIATLLQFLGMAAIITALRWLFFTDACVKNLSIPVRSILMFGCVIVSVGIFARVFGWFPVNHVRPWIMFLVSFLVCTVIGVGMSALKERSENQKMQDALERLKEKENQGWE